MLNPLDYLCSKLESLGSTNHDGYIDEQFNNARELNINGKGI